MIFQRDVSQSSINQGRGPWHKGTATWREALVSWEVWNPPSMHPSQVCQEMAPVLSDALGAAGTTAPAGPPGVNLVMLNIDNSRWTQERRQYHVRGVPQYQFLDGQGRARGALIGKVPQLALTADLEALTAGQEPPFLSAAGDAADLDGVAPGPGVSPLTPPAPGPSPLPRDHA